MFPKIAEIDENDIALIRNWASESLSVGEILRRFIALKDSSVVPVPMLMKSLMKAFGLRFEDVILLNGWRAEGSGEISDSQLDQLIHPHIDENRSEWGPNHSTK